MIDFSHIIHRTVDDSYVIMKTESHITSIPMPPSSRKNGTPCSPTPRRIPNA